MQKYYNHVIIMSTKFVDREDELKFLERKYSKTGFTSGLNNAKVLLFDLKDIDNAPDEIHIN